MKLAVRITASAIVLMLLVACFGCAHKAQTPQYQAGVAVDDFSIALKGLQDVEIALHTSGVVPDANHIEVQKIFLQTATIGKQAVNAVRAGDFTNARQYFRSAIGLLNGLQPEVVGIKNPDSQKIFTIAVSSAIAIAQQWANTLPTSTSATPVAGILVNERLVA